MLDELIFQHFLSSDFFKVNFFAKFFQYYNIRVSNNLGPDQAWHSDGPDLGPNCLQRYQQMAEAAATRKE